MSESANLKRLLAVLGLTIPLLAAAQAPTPPMSDAERARRDAEKVFSFIKFQTVRIKPPAEPASKPPRPALPTPARPVHLPRVAEATTAAAEPAPAAAVTTMAGADTLPAAEPAAPPPAALPASVMGAAATEPAAAAFTAEAEPETDDRDDHEEVALQMQNFVAPVLTPAVQATLGAGARNVKVRFTVEASGQVSKAEAAADVPRRLAKPATDAILQWRFAPLPQARTTDVEIAFRRD
ncbi:MAG: energy transducer TonB [Burkholderiales bacterium]|nr:energy transducer TonB [Burkholderiales bacterium]